MVTLNEWRDTYLSMNMVTVGNVCYHNIKTPFNNYKILNHIDHIKEFLQEARRFQIAPITVEVHPTNRCNLKCRDCTFQNIDRTSEIDSPTLERITQEIINLQTVKAIVWSGGGEPTLHKGLVDSINLFGQAGIDQGIASNGTHITDELVDIAIRYLTYFRVSLNAASRQSYLEIHGADKYWSVRSNIEKLRHKKEQTQDSELTLGASFLVYPENIQEIPLAIKNAADMGLDYLQIKPAVISRKSESLEYFNNIHRILSNLAIDLTNTTIIVDTDKFNDVQSYDYGRNYSTCWGGLFYATIAADKNVYICCHKTRDKNCSYGNLGKETFQEIWFSERKRDILQNVNVSKCPPNCKFHKMNKVLQEIYDSQFAKHKNFL
jgi:GTP 3',8-cyclase